LSDYGDFLLKRSMVASGKEQFFINWVRQFLTEEVDLKGEKWQEKLPQYLDKLAGVPRIADWQVKQADQAVRLYFQIFFASQKITDETGVAGTASDTSGVYDAAKALDDLREWLRINHYALRQNCHT